MSSPVSTGDADKIQKLVSEIEERVNEINRFNGIGNSTGTDAQPVHRELKNIRDACNGLKRAIGTGRG